MRNRFLLLTLAPVLLCPCALAADDPRAALFAAVRNTDVAAIKAALDKGADVNASHEGTGITPLWVAASKGKPEIVELLLSRGADPNSRDGIWYQTPLSSAVGGGHVDIVKALLKAGAKDIEPCFLNAAARRNKELAQLLLDTGKVRPEVKSAALLVTSRGDNEVNELLKKAGALELKALSEADRTAWKPLTGTYESDNGGKTTIELVDNALVHRGGAGGVSVLTPKGSDVFEPVGQEQSTYRFEREGDKASRLIVKRFTAEMNFFRSELKPAPKVTAAAQDTADAKVAAPLNWANFRGPESTGLADGQHPPTTWNGKDGTNVRWKTPIPGLGHSCPIVWGDRVFVTTAISGKGEQSLRIGNYGAVDSVDDTTKHTWKTFCLHRDTGEILWERTACEGVPKCKRHLKGSQANCTPATDGKRVVACFGPEGMYCYDLAGKLIWQRDLGNLDSSFAIDREYEWGFGSSPIIHDGLVILQCDLSKDSFIAAFNMDDGSRVWSTPRDEIPSWSSPTIWKTNGRTEIVTNASQYARGYDPATGKELWRLAKKSECTIPTPVPGRGKMFIVSGNRPIQPIFALRPGAVGDISLPEGESKNAHIEWSKLRGGPYMPTPILYGPHLYICSNAGILTCLEADTGKEVYKERMGGVSYTASPVGADGRLYFTSEQGEIRVVKAGPKFELLAVNDMGDICMATPAISGGALFVRSQGFLWCLGRK
jgi:outer membrane protein assembly factor BamB